jgi:hypothetical protein
MSEQVMRASDQDRDEAILALTDAFADGRLDHGEFESRMETAQRATYIHDLDPLFADLPSRKRTSDVAPRQARVGRAPRRPSFVPFLVLAVLAAVLVTSGHVWVLIPLWFIGFSIVRRMAWRRHAMGYAELPQRHGPRGPHGPHR